MVHGGAIGFPEIAMSSSEGIAACIQGIQNLVGPGKVVAQVVRRQVHLTAIRTLIESEGVLRTGQRRAAPGAGLVGSLVATLVATLGSTLGQSIAQPLGQAGERLNMHRQRLDEPARCGGWTE